MLAGGITSISKGDLVLRAEIQHFLRFADRADHRLPA